MSNLTQTLAAEIQRHHEEAQRCAGEAVEHARKAGEALIKAKAELPHGEWLTWFDGAGFGFGQRMAQNYMRLAKELPNLPPEKRNAVSYLPIRDALEHITECGARLSKLSDDTRDKVTEVAGQQETTFRAALKQVMREEREADYERQRARAPLAACANLNGRPVQVKRNEGTAQWAIVVGPNESGERIEAAIAEAEREPEYLAAKSAADDCEVRAKELEKAAQKLRREAADHKAEAERVRKQRVRDGSQPLFAFTETVIFEPLGPEADAELKTLATPELAASLLEVGIPEDHDLSGNIFWLPFSDRLPIDPRWTKVGYEAGLA